MQSIDRDQAELLLAQAGSLRALARSLVAAHEVEDALQETWARALTHPPRTFERAGAWLAAVLKSVVHKRLRGDGRRALRERRAAQPEALASAATIAAQRETLRRVSDAVLALDEPYQGAILLRYFEDLSPTEIARRLALPLPTVKSRLRRGLAALRAALEREQRAGEEHWALGLIAFTGLDRTAGGIAMGLKGKACAAGALVGLLALLGWRALRLWPEAGPAVVIEDRAGPRPGDDLSGRQDLGAAPGRTAVGAGPAPEDEATRSAPAPEPRNELELELLVRDELDRPFPGAEILLAPEMHPLNRAGRTDEEGRLRVRWRAHRARMTVVLSAQAEWFDGTGLRRVEIAAGRPRAVHLVLRPAGAVSRQVIELEQGQPELGLSTESEGGDDPSPRLIAAAAEVGRDERGFALFRHPAVPGKPILTPADLRRIDELRTRGAGLRAVRADLFAQRARERGEAPVTVRGIVLDERGEPAPGVLVRARDRLGAVRELFSEEDGRYALGGLAAGALELLAGGGDRGRRAHRVEALPGESVLWDPDLDPGIALAGRVVTRAGEPLGGWLVEVQGESEKNPCADATVTDAAGAFAVPNLPKGALSLLLRPPGSWANLPAVVLERVHAGGARELRVDERERRPGSVEIQVVDEHGRPVWEAEVRLWPVRGERGAMLAAEGQPGRYRAHPVPAGRYELTLGAGQHAWTAVEPFVVEPGQDVDLGCVALDPPGALAISMASSPARELVLVEVEREVDLEAGALEVVGPREIPLRRGCFAVWLADDPARRHPVTIEPGARFELHLSKAADRAGEQD